MAGKIGFVILNYITTEETIKCVESIVSRIENYEIIIVDNASPNASGEALVQRYSTDVHIKVLIAKDNLGFARGNNIGIREARRMGCEFVVVLNSDTELMQQDFCRLIEAEYEKKQYAVMGPLIYKNGVATNDNPGRSTPMSAMKLRIFIWMNRVFNALSYIGLDGWLNRLFVAYTGTQKTVAPITDRVIENVALHGCCLVFTPIFFEYFEGFHEGTYMYMEEDLLYQQLTAKGLISAYVPELFIEHKEEGTTNILYSGVKKRRFRYKNYIKSAGVMLKELRSK